MNYEPFQIFDVLNEDDFSKVLEEKYNRFQNLPYIGKHVKRERENSWMNYFEVPVNLSYSSENFGVFTKVFSKIQETLMNKGFVDPVLSTFAYTNHPKRTDFVFHKHYLHRSIDPYQNYIPRPDLIGKSRFAIPFTHFWIAIFYPHDLYEEDYYGNLCVKDDKDSTVEYNFPGAPNSVVLHNGLFGHEVALKKLDPNKIRDAIFTHWLCRYTP